MSGARVFMVAKAGGDGEFIVASRLYFSETEADRKAKLWSKHEPDSEFRVFEADILRSTSYLGGKKRLLG